MDKTTNIVYGNSSDCFAERGVPWHKIGAVDWDGVIGVFPHPEDGERPIPGAMNGLYQLLEADWYIEIHSCGSAHAIRRNRMKYLLEEWSIEFLSNSLGVHTDIGFLGMYPNQINFPNAKPGAKWYLDDRGIKFEGWDHFTPSVAEAFRAHWQHPNSRH